MFPGHKVSDPYCFPCLSAYILSAPFPPSSLSLGGGDGDVPFIEDTWCVLQILKLHSSICFQGCYINAIFYLYTSHCAKNS